MTTKTRITTAFAIGAMAGTVLGMLLAQSSSKLELTDKTEDGSGSLMQFFKIRKRQNIQKKGIRQNDLEYEQE